jgi:ribosome recycling factor
MAYDFSDFQKRGKEVEEWLQKELSMLRTGRASLAMLDNIMVNSYGSYMPVPHVANVSVEDPKTLRIAPWDKGQIKAIEEALRNANLGLSVSADEGGIRLVSPELTSERRVQVVKMLREKFEEARISLRKEREVDLDHIKKEKQDGTMSEDDFFKAREGLQKLVDELNLSLEALADKKQKDIEG